MFKTTKHLTKKQQDQARIKLGVEIKKGLWNEDELKRLRKNFMRYGKNHLSRHFMDQQLRDVICYLLGFHSGAKDEATISSLAKLQESTYFKVDQTRFLLRMGKKLQSRTLKCICYKLRCIFGPLKKHNYELDESEKELIASNQAEGRKFSFIADNFRLHPLGVQWFTELNVNASGKYNNTGQWDDDEVDLLHEAIRSILTIDDLKRCLEFQVLSSSSQISVFVRTRSPSQCCDYFKDNIRWEVDDLGLFDILQTYTRQHRTIAKAKILCFVKKAAKSEEAEVGWHRLVTKLHPLTWSNVYKLWGQLKEEVPPEFRTSHEANVKYLWENVHIKWVVY